MCSKALIVFVCVPFRHGSMEYATLFGIHIFDIDLEVAVNISDINPKSIKTAQKLD